MIRLSVNVANMSFWYVNFAYRTAAMFDKPWINARLMKHMPTAQPHKYIIVPFTKKCSLVHQRVTGIPLSALSKYFK